MIFIQHPAWPDLKQGQFIARATKKGSFMRGNLKKYFTPPAFYILRCLKHQVMNSIFISRYCLGWRPPWTCHKHKVNREKFRVGAIVNSNLSVLFISIQLYSFLAVLVVQNKYISEKVIPSTNKKNHMRTKTVKQLGNLSSILSDI